MAAALESFNIEGVGMKKVLPFLTFISVLTACSGGGGSNPLTGNDTAGTKIDGLSIPANISVVQAKTNFQTASDDAAGLQNRNAGVRALTDADSDYVTDESRTYVYDPSMESLDTVNMILCLMEQTRATDMVNEGAYIALVDEDSCEQGENQSSSGSTGQSSGSQATEYNAWTIESTRADNDSPQIVKIWVPGDDVTPGSDPGDAMDAQNILVEVTITEGISDSNPFGRFSMNFKGVLDAGLLGGQAGVITETMRGSLTTVDNDQNQPQFEFINVGGDAASGSTNGFSFQEASNVILDDASGTGGVALTSRSESFTPPGGVTENRSATFAIAFNEAHMLRGKDENSDNIVDAQICQSRENFHTQTWRYNLYHAADTTFDGVSVTGGRRVELNSGFPFTYDSDNNGTNDAYGWVGYHGVWADGNTIDDGTTIAQFDYENNTTNALTVNVSDGKMIRRTANQANLSDFQGDEFVYWGPHPTLTGLFNEWIVTVNAGNEFQITAWRTWDGGNGPTISSTIDHDNDSNTAEVSVVATVTLQDTTNVWLWSDALGGNVVYVHDATVVAANRQVTFYNQEFINTADTVLAAGDLTLFCYFNCLKGGLTQADVNAASSDQDLYYHYDFMSPAPFIYTLSAVDGKLVLMDDNAVSSVAVSADGLDLSRFGFDWGINTGEMITTPLADATQPWQVFDSQVSYRWETGSNDWNRLITVSNAQGDVVDFDRPLQFAYTHTVANDQNNDSSHDGDTFLLQYEGVGNLHGFPWIEDAESGRWHSAVTLKDGTVLTDGTNNFVVKAIESEQTMQEDAAGCSALNIDSLFTDPALALPVIDNTVGAVSFALSDKPTVTDAPAAIGGELQ